MEYYISAFIITFDMFGGIYAHYTIVAMPTL